MKKIHIRRAEIADNVGIAKVQAAGWRQGYKGIIPASFLDGLDVKGSFERWHGNLSDMTEEKYTNVAILDGQIVGFLAIGSARDEKAGLQSELWAIYIDPDFWGQGIGRALFKQMRDELNARNIHNTYVWILKDNLRGRKFYESMGGTLIKGLTKQFVLNEVGYDEVAYGWVKL